MTEEPRPWVRPLPQKAAAGTHPRAEYMREYRAKNAEKLREQQRVRDAARPNRQRGPKKPPPPKRQHFVGVDTEGWDVDGVHRCMVLVVGSAALYTGAPLGTEECLSFLWEQLQKGDHAVGFFFDYDVTMMLADVPTETIAELFVEGKAFEKGGYVWWGEWGLKYNPKGFFTVRHHGREVTVHDVRKFFQCSFVKALEQQGVPDVNGAIARMKDERGNFANVEPGLIIQYCKDECRLLVDLMNDLQDKFLAVGLSGYPWEGPGAPASKTLTKYLGGRARELPVPAEVTVAAYAAYYGGRFEISHHSVVPGKVWEYDLKSAYPSAMLQLPCLRHGSWEQISRRPGDGLWVGHVSWQTDLNWYPGAFAPLPHRDPKGHISFPSGGNGWYWSVEVPEEDYINFRTGWRYVKHCDCQPFKWVQELYDLRMDMEREQPGSGKPIKDILNSLYGKMAQRIGKGAHLQMVWASLITAITRARVYKVARDHKHVVRDNAEPGMIHHAGTVMIATDAVFLREPAPELELGSGLGQWELAGIYDDLCVVMPGVYFDATGMKTKARGIPIKHMGRHLDSLRKASGEWWHRPQCLGETAGNCKFPLGSHVHINMETHIGLKTAIHRKDPTVRGQWRGMDHITYCNPRHKRDGYGQQNWPHCEPFIFLDGAIATIPHKTKRDHASTLMVPKAEDVLDDRGLTGDALADLLFSAIYDGELDY